MILPLVSEMQSSADVFRGLVDNGEEDNTGGANKTLTTAVLASSVCQPQQTHPQQIYANLSEIMSTSKKYDLNQVCLRNLVNELQNIRCILCQHKKS